MESKLQKQIIELKNAVIELLQNCGKTIDDEFNNIELNPSEAIRLLIIIATAYEQKFTGVENQIYRNLIDKNVPIDNITSEKIENEAVTLEKRISILNRIIQIIEEIEKELTELLQSEETINKNDIKSDLPVINLYKGLLQDCTKERNLALSNLISMCFKNPNYYSKIIECLVSSKDSQIKMMCDLYGLSELLTDKSSNKNLRKG